MRKRILALSFLLCVCFSMNAIAADPVLVDCPIDVWTKVATNTGRAEVNPTTKTRYFYTLRDTGGSAPANDNDALSLPSIGINISVNPAVDIYVKTQITAGTVRVATFLDIAVRVTDSIPAGSNNIGSIEIVDPDDDTRRAEFDNMWKALIYITPEHHKQHEGESFEVHIDTANATVSSLNVAFKTVAGTELAHMLLGFSSSDEIQWSITEGAIWTQGTGTAQTVFNHERNAGGNSTVILEDKNQPTFTASNQVIKNVTGVSGGTVIDPQFTYNASLGASKTAETRNAGHEWIFKNDETYVIKTLATDDNCKMTIDLHWYEHTSE